MVTATEMSQLRRFNFGIRTLQEPVHSDVLVREITRYDSDDAAEVSRRIRETAGLNTTVNEIVALYREAIASHQAKLIDPKIEAKAVSGYLYRWTPRYGEYKLLQASFSHLQTESERQQAEHSQLQIEFQQLQLKVNQLQAENGQIKEQFAQLQAERQCLQTEITALYNSTTMQLRQRLLKLPILGGIVRFLYRLVTGRLPL